jgi:hypothetical protein
MELCPTLFIANYLFSGPEVYLKGTFSSFTDTTQMTTNKQGNNILIAFEDFSSEQLLHSAFAEVP